MTNKESPASASELIYRLKDKPGFSNCVFAAIQHFLAIIVGIMTPALIICGALGINMKETGYIVSMSLLVSGVATFIQIRKIGPVGSGLLSIQGTSFAFIGVLIGVGSTVAKQAGNPVAALPVMFGLCFVGSFIEMVCSRFIRPLRRLITPLVSGIVVSLIGMTLIGAAIKNCAGGPALLGKFSAGQIPASVIQQNVGLAALVIIVILFLNSSRNRWLRMSSIFVGLLVGYIVSVFLGMVDFKALKELDLLAVPIPFKYGFAFSPSAFVGIALLYVVTLVETIGDITATSVVSEEPIEGDLYVERISGGVLGDGFNSMLAAVFNTFPNTTFSQNNGVIQLTGVASRHVGYYVAGFLVLAGLSPFVAGIAALMPSAVLGGATLLMFGTVASSGIRIIATHELDRRGLLILAISLSTGLGVTMVPELLKIFPGWFQNIFSSGIISGGMTAILCNLLIPGRIKESEKPPEVAIKVEIEEE